jgi:hypothetical protein
MLKIVSNVLNIKTIEKQRINILQKNTIEAVSYCRFTVLKIANVIVGLMVVYKLSLILKIQQYIKMVIIYFNVRSTSYRLALL